MSPAILKFSTFRALEYSKLGGKGKMSFSALEAFVVTFVVNSYETNLRTPGAKGAVVCALEIGGQPLTCNDLPVPMGNINILSKGGIDGQNTTCPSYAVPVEVLFRAIENQAPRMR